MADCLRRIVKTQRRKKKRKKKQEGKEEDYVEKIKTPAANYLWEKGRQRPAGRQGWLLGRAQATSEGAEGNARREFHLSKWQEKGKAEEQSD